MKIQEYFCKALHFKVVKKVFPIKKIKNTVPRTCVREDLNGEEIAKTFYEKEF